MSEKRIYWYSNNVCPEKGKIISVSGQTTVLYIHKQLVWYFISAAVWVGRIAWRDEGLLGPCMVCFGAAWCYCMGVLEVHSCRYS